MHTDPLIDLARQLLADGRDADAATCLNAARRLDPAGLDAHNLLEAHRLPGSLGGPFGIEARIAPEDEIYRFFTTHPSSINPVRDYLADGWRTLSELLRLAERTGFRLGDCGSFLEFACGYGRFTRHLVKALPPGALHVSDVMPGSVDFLNRHLGVQGFYSSTDPAALRLPRRYQTIFVLSLFSHLPHTTWPVWLGLLHDALEPGGMLIITTHGEYSAQTAGVALPDDGFLFFPDSESSALDSSAYGSTFTSADYVHRAVDRLPGAPRREHLPAHFWSNQDAYVIWR